MSERTTLVGWYRVLVLVGLAACHSASSDSGGNCSKLASCCLELAPGSSDVCATAVSGGNDATCENELSTYRTAGLCGGVGVSSGSNLSIATSFAFSLPSSSGATASYCVALSRCCAAMAAPGPCDAVVGGAVESTCQAVLAADETAGLCAVTIGTSQGRSGTTQASVSGISGVSSSSVVQMQSSSVGGNGGPVIESLTANPTFIHDGASVTVSAIVSDPLGVSALTGGTLIDPRSGTVYGSFGTPGGQGTFDATLSWDQVNTASPINGTQPGPIPYTVTAKFFDNSGKTTSQNLELTLSCSTTADTPCSGTCTDLTSDLDNCGRCGHACGASSTCTNGSCVSPPVCTGATPSTACVDCVNALSNTTPCITSALATCNADSTCAAFLTCENGCSSDTNADAGTQCENACLTSNQTGVNALDTDLVNACVCPSTSPCFTACGG